MHTEYEDVNFETTPIDQHIHQHEKPTKPSKPQPKRVKQPQAFTAYEDINNKGI